MSTPQHPLLFRDVAFAAGERTRYDVLICDGRIERVSPAGNESFAAGRQPRVIKGRGRLLLPGLHDHHLHLFATAAAADSIHCGPPRVADDDALRDRLRTAAASGDGWLRGIGFHESVCAVLDRHWLDAVVADRPVRIQHRSGMLWILNSCALAQLELREDEALPEGVERDREGALTGRFYDLDGWLGERLPRAWPSLQTLSRNLARYGVTGVTDAGVRNGVAHWRALDSAARSGALKQRVHVMGSEALHDPLRSESGRLSLGPLKIYLREAALPSLDELVARITQAHERGRCIAVHCVTRAELVLALVALREAGSCRGDRIEHGALIDDGALELLRSLDICVVIQPHFLYERGDRYRRDVAEDELPGLIRGASLIAAGIPLAAGSDAPYGGFDPWASMRAAIERKTASGVVMATRERLSAAGAMALYGGSAAQPAGGFTSIEAGQPADLCLLNLWHPPAASELQADRVAMTLCAGEVVYAETEPGSGAGDCLTASGPS